MTKISSQIKFNCPICGPNNGRWKGGKTLSSGGYVFIRKPDHPKAYTNGYVLEQILIAEEVLGKPLPDGVVVHHVNENRADNRKENLVICQDQAYHLFLHQRIRALRACGNPNWRKCWICKKYDDPENLFVNIQNSPYHKECELKYQKLCRQKRNTLRTTTQTER